MKGTTMKSNTIKEYLLFVKFGEDTPDNHDSLMFTFHTYEEAYRERGELMAQLKGKEVHYSIESREYDADDVY